MLKHIVSRYSDSPVTDSVNVFKAMFLDSKIASILELSKDKLKYVANYGIAPHFIESSKEQFRSSECFVVCYDESLNKIIQESEMDLVIRIWNNISNKVQIRYWNSIFLGHTTSID